MNRIDAKLRKKKIKRVIRRIKRNLDLFIIIPLNIIFLPYWAINRGYWYLRGVKYIEDKTMVGMPTITQKSIRGYSSKNEIENLFENFYHYGLLQIPRILDIFSKSVRDDKRKIARLSKDYKLYRKSPALQKNYALSKILMEKEHLPIDEEYDLNIKSFNMVKRGESEAEDRLADAIDEFIERIHRMNREYSRKNFLYKLLRNNEDIYNKEIIEEYESDCDKYVSEHLIGLYKWVYDHPFSKLDKLISRTVYRRKVSKLKDKYNNKDVHGYYQKALNEYERVIREIFGDNINKYKEMYDKIIASDKKITGNTFAKECLKSKYFKNVETETDLDTKYKELVKKYHPDNNGDISVFMNMSEEYRMLKEKWSLVA